MPLPGVVGGFIVMLVVLSVKKEGKFVRREKIFRVLQTR